MGIPLHIICCFSLVAFNIFFCINFFNYVSQHVPPWVYRVWDSLCFLDLDDSFLSHVRDVFGLISSNSFSGPFPFSSSSATPMMRMLVRLMSLRSLQLSSFPFILFSLFCSVGMISTNMSSSSLIRSSSSVILLLFPSSVFFISVILLVISVCLLFKSCSSLLNISYIFSVYSSIPFLRSWIIFTIITLNCFSGRLLISSSFSCSFVFLSCFFICNIVLCPLILSSFLCLWSPFHRLQDHSSFCF